VSQPNGPPPRLKADVFGQFTLLLIRPTISGFQFSNWLLQAAQEDTHFAQDIRFI